MEITKMTNFLVNRNGHKVATYASCVLAAEQLKCDLTDSTLADIRAVAALEAGTSLGNDIARSANLLLESLRDALHTLHEQAANLEAASALRAGMSVCVGSLAKDIYENNSVANWNI